MPVKHPIRPIGDYTLDEIREVLARHVPDTAPSENSQNHAAVAMILNAGRDGAIETLFIRRAEHPRDPWSGQMAFPGGRKDHDDDSLEAAARRETFEEVGLRLVPESNIGRLHDLEGGRLQPFSLSVTPFVYHCDHDGELTLNSEVADAVWIPLDFLGAPENIQDYYFPGDPLRRPFPSFQYGPYTIWGLTYRFIAGFMALFDIELPGEKPLTSVE